MTATTSRRRGALRATLALLGVLGFGAIATLATFTDSGAQPVSFSTGNVDIKFDSASDTPSALVGLNLTNAKPGDTKSQTITVKNAGTLGFGYTIGFTPATTGFDTGLGTALQVTIVQGTTTLYSGSLTGLTTTSRPLAVSGSEALAFTVTLPSTADSSVAGKTAAGSIVFTATQS